MGPPKLSTLVFDGWHAEFQFHPRDLWIGLHWFKIGNCTDVYINFLPCVRLHVSWWFHDLNQ